jgi:hypothetical protein
MIGNLTLILYFAGCACPCSNSYYDDTLFKRSQALDLSEPIPEDASQQRIDGEVIRFTAPGEDELEAWSFGKFAWSQGVYGSEFGSRPRLGLGFFCSKARFRDLADLYQKITGVRLIENDAVYSFTLPRRAVYRSKTSGGDTFGRFLQALKGNSLLRTAVQSSFSNGNRPETLRFLRCEYINRPWMGSPGKWTTLVEATVSYWSGHGHVISRFVSNESVQM